MRLGVKDARKGGEWAVYEVNTGPLSLIPGLGRTMLESGHTEDSARARAKSWNKAEAAKPPGHRKLYKAAKE